VVDDPDREDEGDAVTTAQRATPAAADHGVRRLAAADIPTPFGPFRAVSYAGSAGSEHVALVRGEPAAATRPLVRVHSECLAAYGLQDAGRDTVQANLDLGLPVDSRDDGDAARILLDLGLVDVRRLTDNPAKTDGLRAAGVQARAVSLRTLPTPQRASPARQARCPRPRPGR
jgi:3,4-dihydroxy 2-butanone 4-phosphate synthase/GTP cyclohydrolase II